MVILKVIVKAILNRYFGKKRKTKLLLSLIYIFFFLNINYIHFETLCKKKKNIYKHINKNNLISYI